MKRYILFGCDQYYPAGGSGDEQTRGDSIDELRRFASGEEYPSDWYEVLDLHTGEWSTFNRRGPEDE